MLSGTDVSWGHDGRLGGSRYGTDGGGETVRAGHWELAPFELHPASFDGSGSSRGGAKLAYIRVGRSKHDKVREVRQASMVESLMRGSSNFEGDTDTVLDREHRASVASGALYVVMCDLRSSPSASRAAALCACWCGANVDAGRPAIAALQYP